MDERDVRDVEERPKQDSLAERVEKLKATANEQGLEVTELRKRVGELEAFVGIPPRAPLYAQNLRR